MGYNLWMWQDGRWRIAERYDTFQEAKTDGEQLSSPGGLFAVVKADSPEDRWIEAHAEFRNLPPM